MKINELKIESPFKDLFPISDEVFLAVKEDMEEFGFDSSKAIDIWENIVVDGHTRLKAALELGLEDIPVFEHKFQDDEDALGYAIHNQRDRRNLTDADIIRCVEAVDRMRERGGENNPEGRNQYSETTGQKFNPKKLTSENPSHKTTADIIGISGSKVNEVRAVNKNSEVRQEVERGNLSLHKGAQQVREKIKQERQERKEVEKPSFNRTNDNIEWAFWTWNPVTGCKHGCQYCYARDIANRFFKEKFEPTFHHLRLTAPKNTKVPNLNEVGEHNVFVCSMADLFGEWVSDEWIRQVFDAIENSDPWWNYLFLTKNPKRYLTLDFPERCWIGATADTQKRADEAMKVFWELYYQDKQNIRFLSCEPLSEDIDLGIEETDDPEVFHLPIDWLIIGGRSRSSGMAEGQPEWRWVHNLIIQMDKAGLQDRYYMKPNLIVRAKGYPSTGV